MRRCRAFTVSLHVDIQIANDMTAMLVSWCTWQNKPRRQVLAVLGGIKRGYFSPKSKFLPHPHFTLKTCNKSVRFVYLCHCLSIQKYFLNEKYRDIIPMLWYSIVVVEVKYSIILVTFVFRPKIGIFFRRFYLNAKLCCPLLPPRLGRLAPPLTSSKNSWWKGNQHKCLKVIS